VRLIVAAAKGHVALPDAATPGNTFLAGVWQGFLTNLLNPKVAIFYLSFFPQFLHPERGDVLLQSLELGAVQIAVSGTVNTLLILGAARISGVLARRRGWLAAQRYLMSSLLAGLAVRIALAEKP
jgi:threonine/homoserine/homoserine lactone efflux protein